MSSSRFPVRAVAIAVISTLIVASFVAAGPVPSVGLYWLQASDPTTGAGVSAPLDQLLIRTDAPSLYYKSGNANTSWTKIGSPVGSGGTVTSITCGAGMLCSPQPIIATGTVTLNITPTTCPGGQAEVSTLADGTSGCAAFGSGSVTAITCGAGLSCSPQPIVGAGTATVALPTTTCPPNQAEISTAADGSSACAPFGSTTLSGLTSGTIPVATSSSTLGDSSIKDTGTAATVGNFSMTAITVTMTGTNNDWNPGAAFATSTVIVASSSSGLVVLNGLTGCTVGRHVLFIWADTSNLLQVNTENGGSTTASDRFTGQWGGTFYLGYKQAGISQQSSMTLDCASTNGNTRWNVSSVASWIGPGQTYTSALNGNGQSLSGFGAASLTTSLTIGSQIAKIGTPGVNNGTLGTGSTNWIGNVTGVGATTTTLTYSTSFGTTSWCKTTMNTNTIPEYIVVTRSASAPVFSCFNSTTGAAANCNDFTYECEGQ